VGNGVRIGSDVIRKKKNEGPFVVKGGKKSLEGGKKEETLMSLTKNRTGLSYTSSLLGKGGSRNETEKEEAYRWKDLMLEFMERGRWKGRHIFPS